MRGPIPVCELFLYQALGGIGVWYAQEGLCQTHQRYTFFVAEPVLGKKSIQQRVLVGFVTQGLHPACGAFLDLYGGVG